MDEIDLDHREFFMDMLGGMLGRIDAAMLSTGAAEADLQMVEAALEKTLDMMLDERVDVAEKLGNLAVFFQEADDRFVQTGQGFVLVVLAGVVGRATVEDIAASVARCILGYAAFETETINRYCHSIFVIVLRFLDASAMFLRRKCRKKKS